MTESFTVGGGGAMPIHALVINLIRFNKRACVDILRGFPVK